MLQQLLFIRLTVKTQVELNIIPSKKTHFVFHSWLALRFLTQTNHKKCKQKHSNWTELIKTFEFLSKHSKSFLNGTSSFLSLDGKEKEWRKRISLALMFIKITSLGKINWRKRWLHSRGSYFGLPIVPGNNYQYPDNSC